MAIYRNGNAELEILCVENVQFSLEYVELKLTTAFPGL